MNSPSRHDSQPSQSQPESGLVKQRFEKTPADQLEAALLLSNTLRSAFSRVRTAVESDIVVDESKDASFQRRYEKAKSKVNETEVAYTELVWSQFNDPYKSVTLTNGDAVLSILHGEDMIVGSIRNAVSMKKRTDEDQAELQWSIELDGPYGHGAWLTTERQPGELGGPEVTADEQLEAAALAIHEFLNGALPEEI